jgi:hypothetical protein
MTASTIDDQLERLREAARTIGDNLVELEADPVRMALDDAALEGRSAEQWRAARDRLMELWEWYGAFERLLERATELRGTRPRPTRVKLDEVAALLHGRSIELETRAIPLEDRRLLDTAVHTTHCTPAQLLDRMSEGFGEIRDLVAAVSAAWDTGRARVAAAVTAAPADEELRAQLARLDMRLVSDPLGTDVGELDAIEATIAARAERAARTAALRAGLGDRVADVRALCDAADRAEQEARVAHAELTAKVRDPDVAAPEFADAPVERDLDQVLALAHQEAWDEAAVLLDGCAARAQARLDQARQATVASRAPIEQRNRMRGLLDACLGKAHAVGRIEDRELAELYATASDALHTAPTDLARAGALVRRYQEALR